MAGISSKAGGKMENKFEYNGQEFQDDLEVNWYQYRWRNFDPQIGRFFCVDPLAPKFEYLTPYQFASNNPISMREIEGLEGVKFQEVDENGKLIRHVVEEEVYVVVVDDWNKKAAGRRQPKNRVKSNYESGDVAEIQKLLNVLFNGDDGKGKKNEAGETVFFNFAVKELKIGSTDATSEADLRNKAVRELGTESGDMSYIDGNTGDLVYKWAPGNILLGGGDAGANAEGNNDNVRTRMKKGKELDGETMIHEMLHQFLTRPYTVEHSLGGAIGIPQENFSPSNVTDVLKDAYKSKNPIRTIKNK